MKAMVLNAPSEVDLEEHAEPHVDSGESLVRVTHTGICGTDLKIFRGGIPVHYPLIMGHETVGEVVKAPTGADAKEGAKVIVDPVYYCGKCYQCRAGQTHICPNGGILGRDRDGGFAEMVAAPANNLHLLPDGIDETQAPLVQVLTTCLHAHRLADIFPSEAVIVIGLGVTGLLHVQLAKARGAYPVIGITRSKWKRDVAEQIGADYTFAPGEDLMQQVLDVTEGRGADLVIESVGKSTVLAQAMDLVRIGGRILPFGIYTDKSAELPFYQFYFKEIDIINARAAKGEDYPACLDLVRRGVVDLATIVSHNLPMDQLGGALSMLDNEEPGRLKIILDH